MSGMGIARRYQAMPTFLVLETGGICWTTLGLVCVCECVIEFGGSGYISIHYMLIHYVCISYIYIKEFIYVRHIYAILYNIYST